MFCLYAYCTQECGVAYEDFYFFQEIQRKEAATHMYAKLKSKKHVLNGLFRHILCKVCQNCEKIHLALTKLLWVKQVQKGLGTKLINYML